MNKRIFLVGWVLLFLNSAFAWTEHDAESLAFPNGVIGNFEIQWNTDGVPTELLWDSGAGFHAHNVAFRGWFEKGPHCVRAADDVGALTVIRSLCRLKAFDAIPSSLMLDGWDEVRKGYKVGNFSSIWLKEVPETGNRFIEIKLTGPRVSKLFEYMKSIGVTQLKLTEKQENPITCAVETRRARMGRSGLMRKNVTEDVCRIRFSVKEEAQIHLE